MDSVSITVSASALYQKAKEILNDGMDYVDVFISEADEDLPPAIFFSAWSKSAPEMCVSYEEVEEAQTEE